MITRNTAYEEYKSSNEKINKEYYNLSSPEQSHFELLEGQLKADYEKDLEPYQWFRDLRIRHMNEEYDSCTSSLTEKYISDLAKLVVEHQDRSKAFTEEYWKSRKTSYAQYEKDNNLADTQARESMSRALASCVAPSEKTE